MSSSPGLKLIRARKTYCRQLWTCSKNLSAVQYQACEIDEEWTSAKPYSEIPGPKPWPIPKIGNLWRAIPGIGTLDFSNLEQMNTKLYKEYGPIVRLTGLGGPDLLLLFDPDDAETMYRTETVWPYRPAVEALSYYRRTRKKEVFGDAEGVVNTRGETWATARSAVNKPLLRPASIMNYHQPVQEATVEFVQRIRRIRDEKCEVPDNFHDEVNKWSLESISRLGLNARLGCLEDNLSKDSDAHRLIDAVSIQMRLLYELDYKPSLYKYYPTRDWRKFVKCMDTITEIAQKHINIQLEKIKQRSPGTPPEQNILEEMLSTEKSKFMAVIVSIDLLNGGVDTTATSASIALYYLAKNPHIQDKVLEEVKKVLPTKDSVLPREYLNDIPYLRAVIKETQRLKPLVVGNTRAAGKDIVLKGYQIPKETQLIVCNKTICEMEEYFPRPTEFHPERWLTRKSAQGSDSEITAVKPHPFAVLPFGFGPRSCVGRRIAELEINTYLAQIIRNFKVSYNHAPMEWGSRMLVYPKKPLKFQMVDREN